MGTPLNILHSLQLSALFSLERKRAPRRSRGTTGLQTTPTGPATEAGAPRAFFFFFFRSAEFFVFFCFFFNYSLSFADRFCFLLFLLGCSFLILFLFSAFLGPMGGDLDLGREDHRSLWEDC